LSNLSPVPGLYFLWIFKPFARSSNPLRAMPSPVSFVRSKCSLSVVRFLCNHRRDGGAFFLAFPRPFPPPHSPTYYRFGPVHLLFFPEFASDGLFLVPLFLTHFPPQSSPGLSVFGLLYLAGGPSRPYNGAFFLSLVSPLSPPLCGASLSCSVYAFCFFFPSVARRRGLLPFLFFVLRIRDPARFFFPLL